MKCDILCLPCERRREISLGDGSQFPGEHIKYVKGKNIGNTMQPDGITRCDNCGKHIEIGEPCSAVTIWSDNSPNPYYTWESDFIEVLEQ